MWLERMSSDSYLHWQHDGTAGHMPAAGQAAGHAWRNVAAVLLAVAGGHDDGDIVFGDQVARRLLQGLAPLPCQRTPQHPLTILLGARSRIHHGCAMRSSPRLWASCGHVNRRRACLLGHSASVAKQALRRSARAKARHNPRWWLN